MEKRLKAMAFIKRGTYAGGNIFITPRTLHKIYSMQAHRSNTLPIRSIPTRLPLCIPRCIESRRFAPCQHHALIGVDRYGDCLVHGFNALEPENSNYRITAGKPQQENTIPPMLFWRKRYAAPAGAHISQAGLNPLAKFSALVDTHHAVYIHEASVIQDGHSSMQRLNTLCPKQNRPIQRIDISWNGRFIGILHTDGALYRHDRLQGSAELLSVKDGTSIATLSMANDGTLYASSKEQIYHFGVNEATNYYAKPCNAANLLGLSADERFFITAQYVHASNIRKTEIILQDRHYPERAFILSSRFACAPDGRGYPPLPSSIAFSTHLAYVALGYTHGGVEIFDLNTAMHIAPYLRHGVPVSKPEPYKTLCSLSACQRACQQLSSLAYFEVDLPCTPPLTGLLALSFSTSLNQFHLVYIREDRAIQCATFALNMPSEYAAAGPC